MMLRSASERKALSWEPVRRGPVYCAPACGGGCTWLAYQECVKQAAALAKRLGKEWEPRVWENLGWYWEVVRGDVRMSARHVPGYTATLGTRGSAGHFCFARGASPREALAALCDAAEAYVQPYAKALSEVQVAYVEARDALRKP